MIGEIEWIDIRTDADLDRVAHVRFNTRDRMEGEVCPNEECERSGSLILGCCPVTNEKFAWCLACGYGFRYVPKTDIC